MGRWRQRPRCGRLDPAVRAIAIVLTVGVTAPPHTTAQSTRLGPPNLSPISTTPSTITLGATNVPTNAAVFQLFRNGSIVASGSASRFDSGSGWRYTDTALATNRPYAYQLRAFVTSGGIALSATIVVYTATNAPQHAPVPVVTVESSTVATVTWPEVIVPASPIANYSLQRRQREFDGGLPPFAQGCIVLDTLCELTGLIPGRVLDVMLEVCTSAGCASSAVASAAIPEAVPSGVTVPVLSAAVQAGTTVARWTPPAAPNGIVTYSLYAQGDLTLLESSLCGADRPSLFSRLPRTASTPPPFDLLEPGNLYPPLAPAAGGGVDLAQNASAMALNHGPLLGVNFTIAVTVTQRTSAGRQYIFAKTDVVGTRSLALSVTAATGHIYFHYRPVGAPSSRFVRFDATLRTGVRHRIMLSVDTNVARLFLDDTPVGAARLSALVADCGHRNEQCVLQVGSMPATTLGPRTDFFAGVIHSISFHPGVSLVDFPVPPSRVGASAALLPRNFGTAYPTCRIYEGQGTEVNVAVAAPLRSYLFQLVASTSAGNATSAVVLYDTFPALAEGVPAVNVSSVTAVSAVLSWSAPRRINGILVGYLVEMLSQDVWNSVHSAVAPGATVVGSLQPYTNYTFRLAITNGVGSSRGPSSTVQTLEALPSRPRVVQIANVTSSSFALVWLRPSDINGVLTNYLVRLDGRVALVVSTPTEPFERATLDGLEMARTYQVFVQACNGAGCASSVARLVRTPWGLPVPPPLSVVSSARTLQFSWASSRTIDYFVLERQDVGSTIVTVLLNSSATQHVDQSLVPGVTRMYRLSAGNRVGLARGNWTTFSTLQIPPDGVSLPQITIAARTAILQWQPPTQTYFGLITYRIVVSGPTSQIACNGESTICNVADLRPDSDYTFTVENCIIGVGCTNSPTVQRRTLEARPEVGPEFTSSSVGGGWIFLEWSAPTQPNGRITSYSVSYRATGLATTRAQTIPGTSLSTNLTSGILPFRNYTVSISGCTAAGCTASAAFTTTSGEASPEGLSPPLLTAIPDGSSVQASWSAPQLPNGIVREYHLEYRLVQPGRVRRQAGQTHTVSWGFNVASASITIEVGDTVRWVWDQDGATHDVRSGTPAAPTPLFRSPLQGSGSSFSFRFTEAGVYPYFCTPHSSFMVATITVTGVATTPAVTTVEVTARPTTSPTMQPTRAPTLSPTAIPTKSPVAQPTLRPTASPTESPSARPTVVPTHRPSQAPSAQPTRSPSTSPTAQPMSMPTPRPSNNPTRSPIAVPTAVPTTTPTTPPTTRTASTPTLHPTAQPVGPSSGETHTVSWGFNVASASITIEVGDTVRWVWDQDGATHDVRSGTPAAPTPLFRSPLQGSGSSFSFRFTEAGVYPYFCTPHSSFMVATITVTGVATTPAVTTVEVTARPTTSPTMQPTRAPTHPPTFTPTENPSTQPSARPTDLPTTAPSFLPTASPIDLGTTTSAPTHEPTTSEPTDAPTTLRPTSTPPTTQPTFTPTVQPTSTAPSTLPTLTPSVQPTLIPTLLPSTSPTASPTARTQQPTLAPSNSPTQDPHRWQTVSTALSTNFRVNGLNGGALYEFRVRAATSGGSTASSITRVVTFDTVPARVLPPRIESIFNDSVIEVSVPLPALPNGRLIGASVIVSERGAASILNFQLISLPASGVIINGFDAGVTYDLRTRACTIEGCADSINLAVVTAPESMPDDCPVPRLSDRTIDTVNLTWTTPRIPHGRIVRYNIVSEALGGCDEVSLGYQAQSVGTLYLADGSAGTHIESAFTCSSEACDGAFFCQRNTTVDTIISTEPRFSSLSGYRPFQGDAIRLQCCNSVACATSLPLHTRTLEGLPQGPPRPAVVAIRGGNALQIVWDLPSTMNGVLSYSVTVNGTIRASGESRNVTVTNLHPVTYYSISIESCTRAGCITGPAVVFRTAEGAPSGLTPPSLFVESSTSILVSWTPPTIPNGVIVRYDILRGTSVVHTASNDGAGSYIDGGLAPSTTYAYSIVAHTAGGSTQSRQTSSTTFHRSPQGLIDPSCSAHSASTIDVTWSVPLRPNGVVTHYDVFGVVNGVVVDFGRVSTCTSQCVFRASNLPAFTTIAIGYRVCIASGCNTSASCSARTASAAPANVHPPEAAALSSSAISLTWPLPQNPNGELIEYAVFFLRLGTLPSYNASALSRNAFGLLFRSVANASRSFHHGQLRPYEAVAYFLTVTNRAGQGSSITVLGRSGEAIPQNVRQPHVVRTSSTLVELVWSPPETPNGRISMYVVSVFAANEPTVRYNTTATRILADGLVPFTSYNFSLSAVNGAGAATGQVIVVNTASDVPSGVTPPSGRALNETSAALEWDPPARVNGFLESYTVFAMTRPGSRPNVVLCNGTELSCVVSNLRPHTNYSVTLRVCSDAGCTNSTVTVFLTHEAPPDSMPAPTVTSLSSSEVGLTWALPQSPNGALTLYSVFSVPPSLIVELNGTANLAPSAQINLSALGVPAASVARGAPRFNNRTALISNLHPFTTYAFVVVAENAAGRVASPITTIQTNQSTPGVVSDLTVASRTASSIAVLWAAPQFPNGVIRAYFMTWRDSLSGTAPQTAEIGLRFSANLTGLSDNTMYEIAVGSRNDANASLSNFITSVTCTDPPEAPSVTNVTTATSAIRVDWNTSNTVPGSVDQYTLILSGTPYPIRQGLESFTVSNLEPYTNYTAVLVACATGECQTEQCTSSDTMVVTTDATEPGPILAPAVTLQGSTTVFIAWQPPARPNGHILRYILIRDGNVTLYTGLDTASLDTSVSPQTTHRYHVVVITSGGSSTSGDTSISTPANAPDGMRPPSIRRVEEDRIVASLVIPTRPNGVITRNFILVNGSIRFSGSDQVAVLTGLSPNTQYGIAQRSCIAAGCATSSEVVVRTPCLAPLTHSANITRSTSREIYVTLPRPSAVECGGNWYTVIYGEGNSPPTVLAANQSNTSTIENLMPHTSYWIAIRGRRGATSTYGPWIQVTTRNEAPPRVTAPILRPIRSGFVVFWAAASAEFGPIISYRLLQEPESIEIFVTNASERYFVVAGLAVGNYGFAVDACTQAGCNQSAVTNGTVFLQPPSAVDTIQVVSVGGQRATILWELPRGHEESEVAFDVELQRCVHYTIVQNIPRCIGPTYIDQVQNLQSHTVHRLVEAQRYRVRVGSRNSAGRVTSQWQHFTTTAGLRIRDLACHALQAPQTAQAQCSWTIDASNATEGLRSVVTWRTAASPGQSIATEATEFMIRGLEAGATYTVTVVANATYENAAQANTTFEVAPLSTVVDVATARTTLPVSLTGTPQAEASGSSQSDNGDNLVVIGIFATILCVLFILAIYFIVTSRQKVQLDEGRTAISKLPFWVDSEDLVEHFPDSDNLKLRASGHHEHALAAHAQRGLGPRVVEDNFGNRVRTNDGGYTHFDDGYLDVVGDADFDEDAAGQGDMDNSNASGGVNSTFMSRGVPLRKLRLAVGAAARLKVPIKPKEQRKRKPPAAPKAPGPLDDESYLAAPQYVDEPDDEDPHDMLRMPYHASPEYVDEPDDKDPATSMQYHAPPEYIDEADDKDPAHEAVELPYVGSPEYADEPDDLEPATKATRLPHKDGKQGSDAAEEAAVHAARAAALQSAMNSKARSVPAPRVQAAPAQEELYDNSDAYARDGSNRPPTVTTSVGGAESMYGNADTLRSRATAPDWSALEKERTQREPAASDIGARVTVDGYAGQGVLQYYGPNKLTGKMRCGVALDAPLGKMNGTLKGKRYFDCKPKHGVLCGPGRVHLVGRLTRATPPGIPDIGHNPTNFADPPSVVTLSKKSGSFGIDLFGPDDGATDLWKGHWVTSVQRGGSAGASGKVRVGQKILTVNGQIIKTAAKETVAALVTAEEAVTLELQYDPVAFQAIDDGAELAVAMALLDNREAPSRTNKSTRAAIASASPTSVDVEKGSATSARAPATLVKPEVMPSPAPGPSPSTASTSPTMDVIVDKSVGKIGMKVSELLGGGVEISKVTPGCAADKTGKLSVGMRIVAINGSDATTWPKSQCVDTIKKAETLVLTVKSPPQDVEVPPIAIETAPPPVNQPHKVRASSVVDVDTMKRLQCIKLLREHGVDYTTAKSIDEVRALVKQALGFSTQTSPAAGAEAEYKEPSRDSQRSAHAKSIAQKSTATADADQYEVPTLDKSRVAELEAAGEEEEYVMPTLGNKNTASAAASPASEEVYEMPTLGKKNTASAAPSQANDGDEETYALPIRARDK